MMIDCDACAVRGPACGDCVVSVLLGAPPARGPGTEGGTEGSAYPGIDLDRREQAAIAVLAGSGLVPPLRLVPMDRTGDVARPRDGQIRDGVTRRARCRPEDEQPNGGGRAAV
jgi:hypothetical protein